MKRDFDVNDGRRSATRRLLGASPLAWVLAACAVGGVGAVDPPTGEPAPASDAAAAGDAGGQLAEPDAATLPPDAGQPAHWHDAGKVADSSASAPDTATPPHDSGACGTLVGPSVQASCHSSCSGQACQPNGCFNLYWCDTLSAHCHAPPTSCP